MLVILTALIGFISSSFPNLLRFLEVRMKLKHEIQLASIRLEAAIRNVDATKEIDRAKETVQDTISARDSEDGIEGGKYVEIIRGLLRPFITLLFVLLYFGFKLLTGIVLFNAGVNIDNLEVASKIILDETTVSILMIVIGFYFGSRMTFNKIGK